MNDFNVWKIQLQEYSSVKYQINGNLHPKCMMTELF